MIKINSLVGAFFIAIIAFSPVVHASKEPTSPVLRGMKTTIENAVEDYREKWGGNTGMIFGLVHGAETVVLRYGETRPGSGVAPSADHIFNIDSITKSFVGTLLALEVERRRSLPEPERLELTDPVEKYWPALRDSPVGAVTLLELATHRSGLPTELAEPTYQFADSKKMAAILAAQPLGTKTYLYSNVGVGLLGFVLSQCLNHQSFSEYVRLNLLAPLGMKSTTATAKPADPTRYVQGYDVLGQPGPTMFSSLGQDGARVMQSSLADLLKFVRFHLYSRSDSLGAAARLAQESRGLKYPGNANDQSEIGLVWDLERKLGGQFEIVSHGGAGIATRSMILFDRKNKIGAVFLSNSGVSGSLLSPFGPIFGEPHTPFQPIDASSVEPLAGSYVAQLPGTPAPIRMDVISRGKLFAGNLLVGGASQGASRLWPIGPGKFYTLDFKAPLEFFPPKDGQPASFVTEMNGQTLKFLRTE
jgi:CubicO group peptidase (beta-lactamase class C family)